MTVIPVLKASHSHLFPGARLVAESSDQGLNSAGDVLVIFSDGSSAESRWSPPEEHSRELAVEAYTTGAGTRIEPKLWLLAHDGEGKFKVLDRLS